MVTVNREIVQRKANVDMYKNRAAVFAKAFGEQWLRVVNEINT